LAVALGTLAGVSRWVEWHRAYDDAESPLARRLVIVRGAIAAALDAAPPGPVRVISMCPGDGRDLLGVIEQHPRGGDVEGRLVELDPELAARARAAAPARIEVREGDAANTSAYAGAVPADLVLACGIFGNISLSDVQRAVATFPMLCAPGARVIWTRHRRPPDRTPLLRDAFTGAGFSEVSFDAPAGFEFAVGVHRLDRAPDPYVENVTMFDFADFREFLTPCVECGFVYDLTREEIVARLDEDARAFATRVGALSTDAARVRPAPDVWSPLEYTCHVRDMLRVQHERVALVQHADEPELVPMRRDERAIEDRYNAQDPAVVTGEVVDAASALAARLRTYDDTAWRRTGIYTYPKVASRSVEWIGTHTVHELQHHARDVS